MVESIEKEGCGDITLDAKRVLLALAWTSVDPVGEHLHHEVMHPHLPPVGVAAPAPKGEPPRVGIQAPNSRAVATGQPDSTDAAAAPAHDSAEAFAPSPSPSPSPSPATAALTRAASVGMVASAGGIGRSGAQPEGREAGQAERNRALMAQAQRWRITGRDRVAEKRKSMADRQVVLASEACEAAMAVKHPSQDVVAAARRRKLFAVAEAASADRALLAANVAKVRTELKEHLEASGYPLADLIRLILDPQMKEVKAPSPLP